ncbi:MAG TPA: hypothetical protein DCZ94_09880 [Lentisphaeria bacterium]|nr:MAG: hypothetical protein A2X48_19120 [Lentisphaerae bacterium GWF2_49_21]HBC87252.1 hypothetical protein [Lentisphaeria bacterium]
MNKKITIIVLLNILLICVIYFLFLKAQPYYKSEKIIPAVTDLERSGTRCGPYIELVVDINGNINIAGENLSIIKLSEIIKTGIEREGIDIPILLHADKRANVSALNPIFQVLTDKGIYRACLEVISTSNDWFYGFSIAFGDEFNKDADRIDITIESINLNNKATDYNGIVKYLNTLEKEKWILLNCSGNLKYQSLVDFLTVCKKNKLYCHLKIN